MKVVVNNIKKIAVFGTVLLLVLGVFGGVASAGQLGFTQNFDSGYEYFTGTASVFIIEAVDLRLSQDDGATWTVDLLDGPVSLDIASVGVGEKVGNLISNKPLPTGTYNVMKIMVSSATSKGVVEVDPDDWEGTWEDGKTGIRYYYTQADGTSDKYKDTLVDAEAAAEEYTLVVVDGSVWFEVDIHISAGETTVYQMGVPTYIDYTARYDDTLKFIEGWFYWFYQLT